MVRNIEFEERFTAMYLPLNPRSIKNSIFPEWRNLPALTGHGVAFPNTGAKAFRDLRLTPGMPLAHLGFSEFELGSAELGTTVNAW